MNKSKVCPSLLDNVNVLSSVPREVLITSNDFCATRKLFEAYDFKFKPYEFAKCFSLQVDLSDINYLSCQNDIDYISSNNKVFADRNLESNSRVFKFSRMNRLGKNQTICFIDTGIYPHLDFLLPYNRIVKFVDLVNHRTTPYDDNGHGTFVSGIACGNGIFSAEKMGFAPLSNIISIKALDKFGASNSNVILDAMQWVWENHKKYNISVVCMSFGAEIQSPFDPLSKGAEALWKLGITVVVAGGNSGPKSSSIKSPGCNPHLITVGAYDEEKNCVADFSSRGPTDFGHKPDLISPGVNVIACNNTVPPYTIMSGTSVATPIVAGICANILSKNSNLTNKEVKRKLLSKCEKLTGEIDSEGAGVLKLQD